MRIQSRPYAIRHLRRTFVTPELYRLERNILLPSSKRPSELWKNTSTPPPAEPGNTMNACGCETFQIRA
jgi:hypothetical protein